NSVAGCGGRGLSVAHRARPRSASCDLPRLQFLSPCRHPAGHRRARARRYGGERESGRHGPPGGPAPRPSPGIRAGGGRVQSLALALGGGGARGIAHIAVIEALDDLGVRPVALAGTSIGAFIGAGYASGMSGRDMRRYALTLAHDRSEMFRRVLSARAGSFASLLRQGFGATLLDAEKLCAKFLPDIVPDAFGALQLPLTVMASDLHGREPVAFSHGPLRRALAASIALPTLVRPVLIDDRILIDGGATNPLPFDQLRGRADVV